MMDCIWIKNRGGCPHYDINSEGEFEIMNERLRNVPIPIEEICKICLLALQVEIKRRG